MERFDPDMVPNGSDDAGRYDFKSQRRICRWNCGFASSGSLGRGALALWIFVLHLDCMYMQV